jgi:hypothetical protein
MQARRYGVRSEFEDLIPEFYVPEALRTAAALA